MARIFLSKQELRPIGRNREKAREFESGSRRPKNSCSLDVWWENLVFEASRDSRHPRDDGNNQSNHGFQPWL